MRLALAVEEEGYDALQVAGACRRRVNTANADVWEYVAFACESAILSEAFEPTPASPGLVHTWAYGGPGTPEVPESVVTDLAVELGEPRQAAIRLVGVSMNLVHRFPRIREAVTCGDIDWRKADLVASATLHLSGEAAGRLHDLLLPEGCNPEASLLARITRRRLDDLVDQVLLAESPEDVEEDVEASLATRDVQIRRSDRHGVADVEGAVSTEDGARLASRLRQVARWLRETGDDRPVGVRRSVALGMLADPGRLQELWEQVRALRALRADRSPAAPIGARDADADLDEPSDLPHGPMPSTVLFVHLDRSSDTWSLDGTSASDQFGGALSRAEAVRIVGHDRVRVQPVLDLASELTYTSYVAPPRLRKQLAMRNHGTCVFPSCTRAANVPAGTSSVDYDHSPPWPEGRTCSADGAMLCEPHHRAKTFLGWDVDQVAPGAWVWRRRRRRWLVTGGTTTDLG